MVNEFELSYLTGKGTTYVVVSMFPSIPPIGVRGRVRQWDFSSCILAYTDNSVGIQVINTQDRALSVIR